MTVSDEFKNQDDAVVHPPDSETELLNASAIEAEQNTKAGTASEKDYPAERPKTWTIAIPIFAIIRGGFYMSSGAPGLGIFLVAAGIIGLIAFFTQ